MSSENQTERKTLTIELDGSAQLALFHTLHTVLYDRIRAEMEATYDVRYKEKLKHWREENNKLRFMFIAIATNLEKIDQFSLTDKIGMGLVDLLTEEELREVAMDSKNIYHMRATYLLKNYKYNKS